MNGISIIVCCYNSQERIVKTLEYLSKLDIQDIDCELILIDNNCTDNTVAVSKSTWGKLKSPFPLAIYPEKKPGLSAARVNGIEKSEYGIILFCDDDNWLRPDYLKKILIFFKKKSQAAIVAGINLPVFESSPPSWFNQYQTAYAVGVIGDTITNITNSRGHIWGAGMAVRKKIFTDLKESGFKFLSSDRIGKKIESGGDTELCLACRCLGYEIWFNPEMVLEHYMPSSRLTNLNLKKLNRSFGAFETVSDAYKAYLTQKDLDWKREFIKLFKKIFRQKRNFLSMLFTETINDDILRLEARLGKLKRLLLLKGKYNNYPAIVKRTIDKAKINCGNPL